MSGTVARRVDEIAQTDRLVPADLLPTIEPFSSIDADGRRFTFQRSLRARREYADGLWIYEIVEYSIVAPGQSLTEAREVLGSCIAGLWDAYALADPATLTEEAKDLKKRLQAGIEVTRVIA